MSDSLQPILEEAVLGVVNQGGPSYDTSDGPSRLSCSYRSRVGARKCAVGHLIPDDKYSTILEGWPVEHKQVRNAVACRKPEDVSDTIWVMFLKIVQLAHDDMAVHGNCKGDELFLDRFLPVVLSAFEHSMCDRLRELDLEFIHKLIAERKNDERNQ